MTKIRCLKARRDISTAFHRGAFHESASSRNLNKIAAVLYQLSQLTHTLAASQFFDLFETRNEDNVNCISTRFDVSGCNSKLSNYKLTKKNKGL